MIENLLVRAADAEETTWIERLSEITYDDLLEETGLSLSKAEQELDKQYYDDALRILDIWDTFKEQLEGYDDALAILEELQNKDHSALNAIIENYDIETATEEQSVEYGEAVAELNLDNERMNNALTDVVCTELLESIEYAGGGTLLDYFMMDPEEIEEDVTLLYPLVASLSDGQRAGINLLTLEDLVMIGATDENGYKEASYDELETTSIYEDVNRDIYAPGGVALTSDALRARALEELSSKDSGILNPLTYVMLGLTGAAVIGLAVSFGMAYRASAAVQAATPELTRLTLAMERAQRYFKTQCTLYSRVLADSSTSANQLKGSLYAFTKAKTEYENAVRAQFGQENYLSRLEARSSTCSNFAKGFTAAVIILVAISTYLTWKDLKDHYKVDYTPIPRYMVDEKDITAINANGEKIVIKNQSAYYTAATCNRSTSAEYYEVAKDIADLNGDVGQQWLALYYAKNEAELPILAESLKVVTGNSQIPAGYETGAHMFGVGAAENFNNTLYVWNSTAKSIYLYYKAADAKTAGLTGSGFSAGTVALSGGTGLVVGALVSGLLTKAAGKKRKKEY